MWPPDAGRGVLTGSIGFAEGGILHNTGLRVEGALSPFRGGGPACLPAVRA